MNTIVPTAIEDRAVVYRETAARMYAPAVHWAAAVLVELPWLGIIILASVPIMCVRTPRAAARRQAVGVERGLSGRCGGDARHGTATPASAPRCACMCRSVRACVAVCVQVPQCA